jgi:hypothetical protein
MAVHRVFQRSRKRSFSGGPMISSKCSKMKRSWVSSSRGVEAVPELGPMTVLCEHTVAEAVDRGDNQFREVARVADFAGGGGQAIAHLEGSLLGEGAEHELSGLCLLEQQEV